MSTIYSSLSNPSGDLKQLQQEFSDLINFFNEPDIEPKTRFQFTLNGTIQDITSHLTKNQKEIRLFHFSGHSGQSGLDFEGEGFDIEHVSKFFNALSSSKNLQCVFLNGCENAEIVKRLDKVPVVIGTKSKIQDTVARKVTLDFFKALIGGESNYEDAFTLALQASHIHDDGFSITRSEGNEPDASEAGPLNQYFIQFNDKEIAKQQYAFSPKVRKWIKYVFLLLLIAAITVGWVCRHEIKKALFGYDCTVITKDEKKCNFVIADFTAPSTIIDKPSTWLFTNIKTTRINNYLNPIDLESFSKVISGNSKQPEELPDLCGYEFNLTGSFVNTNNGLAAEFNIFPFVKSDPSYKTVKYKVDNLDILDSLITHVDTSGSNGFVLYEMCFACAMKRDFPDLPSAMQALADEFDTTHSTETYQRFMNDLASVQLHYNQPDKAVKVLDKAVEAVGNDFALYAVERKIEIFDSNNNFLRSIDTHSELINQLQFRIQAPTQYILSKDIGAYKKGEDQVRFKRAMKILKYRDELKDSYKLMAINDFTYLQDIKYGPGNFAKEIALLKGSLTSSASIPSETETSPTPSDEDVDVRLQGYVLNEKGQPIRGAEVQFAIDKKLTDAQGFYNLGIYKRGELKGQALLVFRKGYQLAKVEITGKSFSRIILKQAIPAFTLKGTVLNENGKPLQGAKVITMDRVRETDGNGVYSFGEFNRNQVIGQTLSVTLSGFQDKTITISDDNISQITLSAVAATPEKYSIILNGINIKQDQFKSVMNDLIRRKLPVDVNKSHTNEGAEYFGDRTQTVIYYNDSLKEEAEVLAKLMQMLTDQKFTVQPVKQSTYKSIPMPQQTIIISWYG